MTTYKDIRGTHIKTVTTDPPAPVNGQMWYNSTSQVMKGFVSNPAGSWATTGSLNQAREALAAAGQAPRDTSLVFGGFNNPTKYANTEKFNGSSWTELADLNTGLANRFGFGISTSALAAGGYNGPPGDTDLVESWNGSGWTETTEMNEGRYSGGSAGTSTSGLIFGGIVTPPFTVPGKCESWNGSAWTEVADLNTARYSLGGTGASNTAALGFGGNPGPRAQTESWNGSAWTEVADLNNGRASSSSAGTYTSALTAGGSPGVQAHTETWNGSAWTEENNLNTARDNVEGGGSTAAAIAAGGYNPSGMLGSAEAWTSPVTSTVTFTAS